MASSVEMTYAFTLVIDKGNKKPETIAKNANEKAGEFFGETHYELAVHINDVYADCVATATVKDGLLE